MQSRWARIFAVAAILAIACLGFKYRTRLWVESVVALTMTLYAGALIAAIATRGRTRAFAIGFAVVGGICMLVLTNGALAKCLLTNRALAISWKGLWEAGILIPTTTEELASSSQFNGVYSVNEILTMFYESCSMSSSRYDTIHQSLFSFFMIGHCVWSWLFALLAGWLCGVMSCQSQSAAAGLARHIRLLSGSLWRGARPLTAAL